MDEKKKTRKPKENWALLCPGSVAADKPDALGPKIYGPFPSHREVAYYYMVVHMAGGVDCERAKRRGKYHPIMEMVK